jgi:hypothetical protein
VICVVDCGACGPSCGDGICNGTETCLDCPGDCGSTTCTDAFGDDVCAGDNGLRTCPFDPMGFQPCTCSPTGTWIDCAGGCII